MSYRNGSSLVELIMAITIFSIVVFTLITAIVYGLESIALSGDRNRAVLLAEEGIEASRNIRDSEYSNIVAGIYGLDSTSGEWVYSGTSDVTGKFTREVELSELSTNIYEVVSRVSWSQTLLRGGQVSLVSRLTNWVALGSVTGDWSAPTLSAAYNVAGVNDGLKINVQGNYAYVVTGGGLNDFVIIDVTDPVAPIAVGVFSLSGNLADIEVEGNYAYIASSSNNSEVIVYDISNPLLPLQVDTLNLTGNNDATALDIDGNVLYVVRNGGNQQLVSVNISDPTNVSVLDNINASGNSNDVEVENGYAYVASSSNSAELEIFDVSDPSNISFVEDYDYPGGADINAVEVFDEFVLAGRVGGDLYISDYSDFNSPVTLSIFDAQDNINDMDVGNNNNYVFLGTDENNFEAQIVDIFDKTAPFQLGIYDANEDLNGVYYDAVTDRYYGVSDSNTFDILILSPS